MVINLERLRIQKLNSTRTHCCGRAELSLSMSKIHVPKPDFSFVSKGVLNAILKCNRIVIAGMSNDYYKIYFFSDLNRYYKIELKCEGSTFDGVIPKRFSDGGHAFFKRKVDLYQLVDRSTARKMLRECSYAQENYKPVTKPNLIILQWVDSLLASA